MLMVVFGAGASNDSIDPRNLRFNADPNFCPPLAAGLFQPRPNFGLAIDRFHEIRGVIGTLRNAIDSGANLEQELERLKTEAAAHPRNHRYLAAMQFYLQKILYDCGVQWGENANGVTNYATLLNQLERWRTDAGSQEPVALVTFNYDTMLDTACEEFEGAFRNIDDYTSRQLFPLFKLHGSVDWMRVTTVPILDNSGDLAGMSARHTMIAQAPVIPTDQYRIKFGPDGPASVRDDTIPGNNEYGLYPAVAIPVIEKDDTSFACPSTHLNTLKRVISRVNILLVIGWRAQENHFLSLWEESNVQRVVVVSRTVAGADATMDALRLSGILRDSTGSVPIGDGFSGLTSRRDEIQALISGSR